MSGWVIDNGKDRAERRYRDLQQGMPAWTPDKEQALRFARRIDAEKYSEEDEDAWRITECSMSLREKMWWFAVVMIWAISSSVISLVLHAP